MGEKSNLFRLGVDESERFSVILSFRLQTRGQTDVDFSNSQEFQKIIMSNDVAWAVTRNSSRYLLKKRNCPKPFSTEPMNLTNKHSQRYSGLCNSKAIGVAFPAEKAQGFQVVLKKPKCANKPAKSTTTTALKSGPRRAVPTLKRLIPGQRYRKDLTAAAVRRASAICRSQKPLPKRKGD